jgi:hypothetical protein
MLQLARRRLACAAEHPGAAACELPLQTVTKCAAARVWRHSCTKACVTRHGPSAHARQVHGRCAREGDLPARGPLPPEARHAVTRGRRPWLLGLARRALCELRAPPTLTRPTELRLWSAYGRLLWGSPGTRASRVATRRFPGAKRHLGAHTAPSLVRRARQLLQRHWR